jgi:hypothetical protein
VNDADEPASIRTGGAIGEDAAVEAGAAVAAGEAASAGAAMAGAAGVAASVGAVAGAGAAGAAIVSADALSLLLLGDWQPATKITATTGMKDHCMKRFAFCINFLCSAARVLSFNKNAASH